MIARLGGGLGNQLFHGVSTRPWPSATMRVPLKLDIVGGSNATAPYQRQHLLDHILPPENGRCWEARRFPLGQRLRKLERRINARRPLDRRRYVEEPGPALSPGNQAAAHHPSGRCSTAGRRRSISDDLEPGIRERIVFPDELMAPIQAEADQIRTAEHPVCPLRTALRGSPQNRNTTSCSSIIFSRR